MQCRYKAEDPVFFYSYLKFLDGNQLVYLKQTPSELCFKLTLT